MERKATASTMANAMSRRSLLAALGATAATVAAPTPEASAELPKVASPENPALLEAYERYLSAAAELADAENALEWLNDEWRHRWPLAPEELLNLSSNEYDPNVERDLIGRVVMREATELTKRLHADFRREPRKVCFTLYTEEYLESRIHCLSSPVKARTDKAVTRRQIERDRLLAEHRDTLKLAREYYVETATVRELSGVAAVQERLANARVNHRREADAVWNEPALTADGLRVKAAVFASDNIVSGMAKMNGTLSGLARFIQETSRIIGEA